MGVTRLLVLMEGTVVMREPRPYGRSRNDFPLLSR